MTGMENKNAWEKYPEGKDRKNVMDFAEDYRKFISKCKTERECVQEFEALAKKAGFISLEERMAPVGDNAACHSWRFCKKRRHSTNGKYWG